MSDTEDLMQPGNTHWMDEAACIGDSRFIDPNPGNTSALKAVCKTCPVFNDCAIWAVGKAGVFAAGSWREQEIVEPWHGIAKGSI